MPEVTDYYIKSKRNISIIPGFIVLMTCIWALLES